MKLTSLIALMRLDKPIGVWLVYFPAGWAVALAAPMANMAYLQAIMLVGAVITRAAGCIINDLTDRELDSQVARTRMRPLASGAVTRLQAVVVLGVLGVMALLLALLLPPAVFTLALVAVPMIAAYPWMKRITWWPQVFLGLTFNLSALFGWLATGTALTLAPITLYAAAMLWTLGYDTIYAVQDMQDDAQIGIRSTALKVGVFLRPFVGICYATMLLLLLLTGTLLGCGLAFYMALALAAGHAGWQVRQLPPTALRAGANFRSNQWLGLVVLLGCLLARLI